MIRAIRLEWYKLRKYRPFTIMLALYILSYFAVGLSIKGLTDFILAENQDGFSFFTGIGIPLFDFVDIWQNLAYITFLFKVILAFIIIISVCTEYENKTIRQNFIDGLSRDTYILSKVSLIGLLSLLAGVLLFVLGMTLGLLYSPVKSWPFIAVNLEFIPAYMLEVFGFLSFALFSAILIRRTGFTIVVFTLYSVIIEPIATSVMKFEFDLPVWYFPVKAINNMIRNPFPKFLFREVRDYIALADVGVVILWTMIFISLSYYLVKKRDV